MALTRFDQRYSLISKPCLEGEWKFSLQLLLQCLPDQKISQGRIQKDHIGIQFLILTETAFEHVFPCWVAWWKSRRRAACRCWGCARRGTPPVSCRGARTREPSGGGRSWRKQDNKGHTSHRPLNLTQGVYAQLLKDFWPHHVLIIHQALHDNSPIPSMDG